MCASKYLTFLRIYRLMNGSCAVVAMATRPKCEIFLLILCLSGCRNSVRLVIRKVQFAPEKSGPQPVAETTRHFLMSDRSLHLEASLDKEVPEGWGTYTP